MPVTVLIASPERLATFQGLEEFEDAIVFADTDALRALEAITRRRPDAVALDRVFAATSRGVALINRIKADPALTSCEIRLVPQEAPGPAPAPVPAAATPASPRADVEDAPSPRQAANASAVNTSPVITPQPSAVVVPFPIEITALDEPNETVRLPLDQRGTRSTPRHDVAAGLEVLVDGNPATLINLSLSGAQVVSLTILRPNQRVRLSLPDPRRPVRCSASVAWAVFEMPREGPQYRAGLAFLQSDEEAIQRFIDEHSG